MRKVTLVMGVAAVMILSFILVRAEAETIEEAKERIRREVIEEYGPPPVKQPRSGQSRGATSQEKKQDKPSLKKKTNQPAQKTSSDISLPFGVSPEAAFRMVTVMMLFAVIPAVIARLKGRSFIAWWVLGALFFIFVLPIAVFMRSTITPRAPGHNKAVPKPAQAPASGTAKAAASEKTEKNAEKAVPGQSNEAVDIYAMIEKLSELKSKGVLTDEEFKTKKNELLGRI